MNLIYFLPVNLLTISGLILMILGFLLLPFIIGLPIFILGTLLSIAGILKHIVRFLPGHKKIKDFLDKKINRN